VGRTVWGGHPRPPRLKLICAKENIVWRHYGRARPFGFAQGTTFSRAVESFSNSYWHGWKPCPPGGATAKTRFQSAAPSRRRRSGPTRARAHGFRSASSESLQRQPVTSQSVHWMSLSQSELRVRAEQFAREWVSASSERADAQTFWNEFFQVFGVSRRRVATRGLGKSRSEDGSESVTPRSRCSTSGLSILRQH
jgi:hypothetical protein